MGRCKRTNILASKCNKLQIFITTTSKKNIKSSHLKAIAQGIVTVKMKKAKNQLNKLENIIFPRNQLKY
jgi:hypothetical protein